MPKRNTLLVVIKGMDAVIHSVVLSFLYRNRYVRCIVEKDRVVL